MGRLLFIIILFHSALYVRGQDSSLQKSKFEKFTSRTGKMFRIDQGHVGKTKDASIELNRTIDLESGDSSKAILISQVSSSFFLGVTNVGSIYIDYEEISGVVKSLDFYKKAIQNLTPQYEPFYQYFTSNDVAVVCYYRESGVLKGWNIVIDKRYHYSRNIVNGSEIIIKLKDLDDFIKLFKHTLEVNFKQ